MKINYREPLIIPGLSRLFAKPSYNPRGDLSLGRESENNLEVTTSNSAGYISKHIQHQELTLPLEESIMAAKTAPYPLGLGRENDDQIFKYNLPQPRSGNAFWIGYVL
jgi:hypothetical protein